MRLCYNIREQFFKLSGLLALALVISSCGKHPKTFSPTASDSFTFHSVDTYGQAGDLYQADYLITLDTSYSTLNLKDTLADSIRKFTAKLRSEGVDYRVGFALGNIQSTCSDKKSCVSSNFMGGVLTPSAGSSSENAIIDSIISQIAKPLQPDVSVPLETADKVLKTQGSSFLRPAAQLVIVMISDDEDVSDTISGISGGTSAANYASKFKAYKANPGYVSARAIIYDSGSGCSASGIPGSSNGARISSAANSADHVHSNVVQCITSDFSQSLQNLAINVTVPTDRFVLQQAAVPGTVQVYVGSSIGTLSLQTASTDYNFSSNTNEVVFTSGNIPANGSAIQFSYEPILRLAANPNPASIQVFVNGSQVPRSDSNGYTYIAGENRIMLWGSAAVQEATVRVSYELAQ